MASYVVEARGSDTHWWECPRCLIGVAPSASWHLCADDKIIVYDLEAAKDDGLILTERQGD